MSAPSGPAPRRLMPPEIAGQLSRLLVGCHPRRWRQRYAAEILDVLDQHQPSAHTVADLWLSAVVAQLDPTWRGRPSLAGLRSWVGRTNVAVALLCAALVFLVVGCLGLVAYQDERGNLGPPMPLGDGTFGMAVSADGRLVAAINPNLEIWSLANPAKPVRLGYSVGDLVGAPGAFAPNGWLLVTSGGNGKGILWNVSHSTPRPKEITTLPPDHTGNPGGVNQFVFFPDGRTLAAANANGTMSLWDTADPRHPAFISSSAVTANTGGANMGGQLAGLTALAVSRTAAGGVILASGDQDGVVVLWNAADPARMTRTVKLPPQGGKAPVSALAFSPGGRVLASATDDGTVVLRDMSDPAAPAVLAVLKVKIPGTRAELDQLDSNVEIAFSADGRSLTAIGGNTAVTRWNVADPRAPTLVFTLKSADTIGSGAVAFAPGGGTVVGPPPDGDTLALWHLP